MIDPYAHTAIAGYGVLGARPGTDIGKPKGRTPQALPPANTPSAGASAAVGAFGKLSKVSNETPIAVIKKNPVVQGVIKAGLEVAVIDSQIYSLELKEKAAKQKLKTVKKNITNTNKAIQLAASLLSKSKAPVLYEQFMKRWKVAQSMFSMFPEYPVVGSFSPKTKKYLEDNAHYDKDEVGSLSYPEFPVYDVMDTSVGSAAWNAVTKGVRFLPPTKVKVVDYYEYKGKGDSVAGKTFHPNTKGEWFRYNGKLANTWADFVLASAGFLEVYTDGAKAQADHDKFQQDKQKLEYQLLQFKKQTPKLKADLEKAKRKYESFLKGIKGEKAQIFIKSVVAAAIEQGRVHTLTKHRELLDQLMSELASNTDDKTLEAKALYAKAEHMEDGPAKDAVLAQAGSLAAQGKNNRTEGTGRANRSEGQGDLRTEGAGKVETILGDASEKVGEKVELPDALKKQLEEDMKKKKGLDDKVTAHKKKIDEQGKQLKELLKKIKELSNNPTIQEDAEETEEDIDKNEEDLDLDEEKGIPWGLILGAAAAAAQFLG